MATISAESLTKLTRTEQSTSNNPNHYQERHEDQPSISSPTQQQNLYIFGKNISFSKSPYMHNAAFAHHNLTNYTYSIREVDSVSDCEPFIRFPDFKGASVTMPYKLQIAQFCDTVTDEARLMGAVNTLSVHRSADGRRMIRGDNTDWSGLVQCIQTRYPGYDAARPGHNNNIARSEVILLDWRLT